MNITYSLPGDGQTFRFPVRFPYIEREFVRVFVGDDEVTQTCSWPDEGWIQIYPPPADGSTVTITRKTPQDRPLVTFEDGATLTKRHLFMATAQSLHVMQEMLDTIQEIAGDVLNTAGEARKILNLHIAVEAAPYGHAPAATYDETTGLLLFRIPAGRDGVDGKDGEQGPPGPPGQAPRLDVIDCGGPEETQLTIIDGGLEE